MLARLYRRAGENEKADRALEQFQALKRAGGYVRERTPPNDD